MKPSALNDAQHYAKLKLVHTRVTSGLMYTTAWVVRDVSYTLQAAPQPKRQCVSQRQMLKRNPRVYILAEPAILVMKDHDRVGRMAPEARYNVLRLVR